MFNLKKKKNINDSNPEESKIEEMTRVLNSYDSAKNKLERWIERFDKTKYEGEVRLIKSGNFDYDEIDLDKEQIDKLKIFLINLLEEKVDKTKEEVDKLLNNTNA